MQRLEDDVLAVVQLPVAGEDAALLEQAPVQGCAGEGRQQREARQVDASVDGELHCFVEHVRRVVIEPEHEAALDCDIQRVQVTDQLA